VLRQRVVTAAIAVVLLLAVLFYLPAVVARIVIAALFIAAAWEWSQFLGSKHGALQRRVFVALTAALGLALTTVPLDPTVYLAVLYAAALWWLVALLWVCRFPTPIPVGVAWLCGLLTVVPAWLAVDWLYRSSIWLLLAMLVLVWLADIGAYFSGRAFGRVKLAPRVSPGKSWEGVIGGLLLAVAVAAGVTVYLGARPLVVVPLAVAVVSVSVVGDLAVSMFKRHAGVKDSGRLFPGHGGVLDRIDSLCAAAPVFAAGSMAAGLA